MKKCHYHIGKDHKFWCSFMPSVSGFHFLRGKTNKFTDWMVWDGKTYIGSVYEDKNKYVIGFENFDNITVYTPVSFPTLQQCARWLTRNSRVAKQERLSAKYQRKEEQLEKKAIKRQALNRKKVSELASKLGVSITFVDEE